jgi:drug/metabolite transporter (DMT)-like permease
MELLLAEAAHLGPDNLWLAIGAILATSCALALGDAVIKQISTGFPLWQIFVLRSVIAIPALIVIAVLRGQGMAVLPNALGWAALRSLLLVSMWVSYYAALPHVALSLAAAVYYTLPLFITLFAAAITGERVGIAGWTAVMLGFIGVLLILKPKGVDFNAYTLLPLLAAVLYALAMILTRTKCRDESPLALSLVLNVTFIATGGLATSAMTLLPPSDQALRANPFLLSPWATMATQEWLVMVLLATATIIGSVGTAIAYQSAPSSVVSTYDFAYLAFAALWGLVFFAEVPDGLSAVGIVLIAAGGIVAVRRS